MTPAGGVGWSPKWLFTFTLYTGGRPSGQLSGPAEGGISRPWSWILSKVLGLETRAHQCSLLRQP